MVVVGECTCRLKIKNYKLRIMVHFDECEHKWKFHIDSSQSSWPAAGNTMFECINCKKVITLQEKCALEQNKSLQESALIQERNTRIAMWWVIISTASCLVALFVFLFGEKTLFL